MNFRIANSKEDIQFCRDVILALRPNLREEDYADRVLEMIAEDHFQLVFIPNEDNTSASAFAGYRIQQLLRTGKMIYIDDLYTAPGCRARGYAGALLDYIAHEAEAKGIRSIHLDSGYLLHTAHRLYLNKGYILACNHFTKQVGS